MAIQADVQELLRQNGSGGNGDGPPWAGRLEVAQAFYRWQHTYSPAGTLEQEFFACPVPDLCTVHQDYPIHKHYLLQQALPACLPGWDLRVTASFRSEEAGTLPLRRIVVPGGPGTWGTALDAARLGYALVAVLLRGAIKGLVLSGAFFAARDYLEHRRPDRGELF